MRYHKLLKYIIQGVAVIAVTILSLQCIEKPAEFIAPVADARIEDITLLAKTNYFGEMIKRNDVVENADHTISYLTTQSFPAKGLDSLLKVTPKPSSQQVAVGVFSIGDLPTRQINVSLTQMGITAGTVPALPATTVELTTPGIDYSDQMDYVSAESGILTLSIYNNLPVAIIFNKPLTLRNTMSGDTSAVASFNVGRMEARQTRVLSELLAGKLVRGLLKFDTLSFTTEEQTSSVTLSATDGVILALSAENIKADSAFAVIPEQPIASVADSVITVDDSIVVREATFRAGTLEATIENQLDINVGVDFEIQDVKQNGGYYHYSRIFAGKQNVTERLDFQTLRIQPVNVRQFGTDAQFSISIATINSGGEKRRVTKDDYVRVSIAPPPAEPYLYISTVRGKIPPQTITIQSAVASNVDFRDLNKLTAEEINLRGIQLALNLPMSSGFPVDYNLKFYAKNTKRNSIDSIALVSNTPGFPRVDPTTGVPVIPISNVPTFDSFISKFFPEVPDSFYIRGFLVVSPRDVYESANEYTIYDTTKVYPSMDVNFPFVAGIKNGHFKETVYLKDSKNVPTEMTERTREASLTFNFVNRIPFSMTFKTFLFGYLDSDSLHYGILDTIATSDTIKAAQVDANGYTTAPVKSVVKITLNRIQTENFNRADSLQIDIALSTTGNTGVPVKVRTTDYIKTYIVGTLIFNAVKP